MKLKRLIVQGFKSFKDKAVINFEDGITGIVGPNGCGKSNIVDALFWVMGEQSAKHLRGNSMKDVIFSGSSKYAPAAWAEVSLVLSNDEGKHIHIGDKVSKPSEIQLTRKLYRNGETEYRINNIPGRLKDIHEVFMDTGAGAKSYSVIAQGEINRLVQAKPQERRVMIEEVAGITKFKIRKKESLKKIDQTQSNLNRLNDLKVEIQKNLSQLHKQAEKAEQARTLKQRIENYDLIVSAHKEWGYLKEFREGQQQQQERVIDLEGKTLQKANIEIGLQQERHKKVEYMDTIENLQREFSEISKNLAAAEERLHHLKKARDEKNRLIEVKKKENIDWEKELKEREVRLEGLEREQELLTNQNEDSESFEDLEDRVETLKEEIEGREAEISELRTEVHQRQEALKTLEHQWLKNTGKAEEFSNNLQQITSEIDQLEKEFGQVSGELSSRKILGEDARLLVDELTGKIAVLKEETHTLSDSYREAENSYQQKSKEYIQVESKLSSLRDIQQSGDQDDFSGNQKFAKSNYGKTYKMLGHLIECDDIYAQGLQNLFNEKWQSLAHEENTLDSLLSWHNDNKGQGLAASFLQNPLEIDEEKIAQNLREAGFSDVVACRDIVRINKEEFAPLIQELLKGSFLVGTLDEAAVARAREISTFRALASFDGKTMLKRENGAVLCQFTASIEGDKKQGLIARNNMIAELAKKYDVLKVEIQEAEKNKNQLKLILENKKQDSDQLMHKMTEAKTEYASHKSSIESKEHSFKSFENRLQELHKRKIEVSKSRLSILESEEKLTTQIDDIKDNLEGQKEKLEDWQEQLSLQKENFNEEKENLIKKQTEAKNHAYRVENVKKQILDFEEQIKKLESRLQFNQTTTEENLHEVAQMVQDIDQLAAGNKTVSEDLAQREKVMSGLKDELHKVLLLMEGREKEVQGLSQKISSLEKEIALKKVKLDQILVEEEQVAKNILEKYKTDLRALMGTVLNCENELLQSFADLTPLLEEILSKEDAELNTSFTFHKKSEKELQEISQKLRKYKTDLTQLGEINWAAVQEYDRQKKRFDFLVEQEDELKKSVEDLKQAIIHIDEKSKVKFQEAYSEVNVRFEKVFPILFGGGSARLELVQDPDFAEPGVDIIAQPPGKKMQNINLMSGGEKAMTAVSLIFSIFLVKPSPFCLLDEVDAPLDDANVGRFNELLREMSQNSQFILITHNKKTMELNDVLYGVTMQEPGVSKAVSVQLH